MARFYKTQSAAPIEYMYQMNIPLMQQAIAANEAGVNQQIQQAEAVGDLASKFSYLTPDADRARAITQQYDQQVDDLTRAIQENPMEWRKKKGALRDLSRDLQTNYQVGEINKIAGNYAKYKELDDYITKREEAGKLSPYEGSVFRQRALESLSGGTGYDPATGKYNQIKTTKPMDTVDIRERVSKFIDNMKANEQLEWDTQAGQYFKKTTQGREYIDPERIIQAALSGIMGDTELQQYMKQRSDFGLMNGVYDKEGKFIAPYQYVNSPATDIEKQSINTLQNQINEVRRKNPNQAEVLQKQLDEKVAALAQRQKLEGNKESSLFPIISSLASEYSYQKVKQGTDLKNNALYNLGVNLDFQRGQKAADRAQKERFYQGKLGQADQFHKDMMDFKWAELAQKEAAAKAKAAAKPGAKTKVGEIPLPTVVGEQDADPWRNSNIYTNKGLKDALDNGKKEMDSTSTKVRSYQQEILNTMKGRKIEQLTPDERRKVDALGVQLNAAQDQLQEQAANTNWARQWYMKSLDYALNGHDLTTGKPNLTPEEKELYERFKDDRYANKLREDIRENAERYGYPTTSGNAASRFMRKLTSSEEEEDIGSSGMSHMDKVRLLEDYDRVQKKVNGIRQLYLDKARTTNQQAPTIEFGKEDAEEMGRIMRNKTHGLNIFDFEGKEGAGIDLGNEAMTFRDGSLNKYLADHKGEIEWLNVSPSMGFGDNKTGAVARVRIKSTDGSSSVGKIPTDKDFYVTLDPASQQTIGLKYSQSKNPQIAALGNQLLDGRNQQIRNKFIDIRNQVNSAVGEYGPGKDIMLPVPGKNLPVRVRSFDRGGGEYDYYVTLRQEDGSEIPMRSTGRVDGFFDSIDHFISDFNKNLNEKKFTTEQK